MSPDSHAQIVARHASPTPVVQVWHVIVSRLLLVGPPRRETVDLFNVVTPQLGAAGAFPPTGVTPHLRTLNTFYQYVSLGLRMALQPHQRSAIPQSRARGSPLTPAGHRSSGSDDYLSSERRGTPHDTTEGRDRGDSARSDHSHPYHSAAAVKAAAAGLASSGSSSSPGRASHSIAGHRTIFHRLGRPVSQLRPGPV